MTKVEAGFVTPAKKLDSQISEDRYCCANCHHYGRKTSSCRIVEGSIDDRDCCNWFFNEPIPEGERQKEVITLEYEGDDRSKDVAFPAGVLGSAEAYALYNGKNRILIDAEALKETYENLKRRLESSASERLILRAECERVSVKSPRRKHRSYNTTGCVLL